MWGRALGAATIALLLTGCQQEPEQQLREESKEAVQAITDDDARFSDELGEAVDAAGEALHAKDHKTFGDRVEDALERAEDGVEDMRARMTGDGFEDRLSGLERELAEARAELTQLAETSEERWEDRAERLNARVVKLSERIEALDQEMKKDEER
ncbi:MAG: hypothetical protein H6739_35730 [Alphaproteobacteria bacterium]|nr:hypothetical protein [Alphaproteobacteria bacterium]